MNIRPVNSEQAYDEAIERIETLWGAESGTPEGDELDNAALIDRAEVSDHKADGFLQEERLVSLIRAALNCRDYRLANSLFGILLKRCIGFIYKHLKLDDGGKRGVSRESYVPTRQTSSPKRTPYHGHTLKIMCLLIVFIGATDFTA